jgi:hypothetical protein
MLGIRNTRAMVIAIGALGAMLLFPSVPAHADAVPAARKSYAPPALHPGPVVRRETGYSRWVSIGPGVERRGVLQRDVYADGSRGQYDFIRWEYRNIGPQVGGRAGYLGNPYLPW